MYIADYILLYYLGFSEIHPFVIYSGISLEFGTIFVLTYFDKDS